MSCWENVLWGELVVAERMSLKELFNSESRTLSSTQDEEEGKKNEGSSHVAVRKEEESLLYTHHFITEFVACHSQQRA